MIEPRLSAFNSLFTMNYYFYIWDIRDLVECCRYCIEKWFLFKNQKDWFYWWETLERLIEKDKNEYHKYFSSFKYITISYWNNKREADYWFHTDDGVNLWWIEEFKCIVNFLTSQWNEIVEDIKKQKSYQIKDDLFKKINSIVF